MDSSKKASHSKWNIGVILGRMKVLFWTGLVVGAIFTVVRYGPPLHKNTPKIWLNRYADALYSVQYKVDRLRRAEEDNFILRDENANLRLKVEKGRFDCVLRGAADATQTYKLKLNKETGTRVGRTLASLSYRVPERLNPNQIYALGVNFLKAREDEKVAVIFTTLTGLEDNATYLTVQNYLITGIAWYRLENYTLADFYFDQVLKMPEKSESLPYQAKARLWKALTAKMLNHDEKSQTWLKELVDYHPHSPESGWVNVSKVKNEDDSEEN